MSGMYCYTENKKIPLDYKPRGHQRSDVNLLDRKVIRSASPFSPRKPRLLKNKFRILPESPELDKMLFAAGLQTPVLSCPEHATSSITRVSLYLWGIPRPREAMCSPWDGEG